MQQQASYMHVHAWSGKVLTKVHIGRSYTWEGLSNRPQLSKYTCNFIFPSGVNFDLLIQSKSGTRSRIKAEVQQNKS